MGYGTRSHDWELGELESMNTLCLYPVSLYQSGFLFDVIQPIVADHLECQADMPH
jgi:hypothetical protein